LFCNRQDRGPVHASHALTVRAFARMPTHAMRLHEWAPAVSALFHVWATRPTRSKRPLAIRACKSNVGGPVRT
jgi:hypothetical protein